MDISGTDFVIAYISNAREHSIFVTKLDASLRPVFWNVEITLELPQTSYAAATKLRAHTDASIHILWTRVDGGDEFVGPPCQRSLHYSRLSGTGEVVVEDQQLTPDQVIEDCRVFHPTWDVDAEGNPVILGFRSYAELPSHPSFDKGCYYFCVTTVKRGADGTFYGISSHIRTDARGRRFGFHIGLFAADPQSGTSQRVAVLASTDPGLLVSLPLNQAFTASGALVSAVGSTGLVVLLGLEFRRIGWRKRR